jgi:hypothetical protein
LLFSPCGALIKIATLLHLFIHMHEAAQEWSNGFSMKFFSGEFLLHFLDICQFLLKRNKSIGPFTWRFTYMRDWIGNLQGALSAMVTMVTIATMAASVIDQRSIIQQCFPTILLVTVLKRPSWRGKNVNVEILEDRIRWLCSVTSEKQTRRYRCQSKLHVCWFCQHIWSALSFTSL